jgi:hypothetical protein
MGVTGAGKSTFISLLADQEVVVGHSLESSKLILFTCKQENLSTIGTTEVGVYSFKYMDGRRMYLVDTPGFDDTNRPDVEILKDIAFFLSTVYQKQIHLAGVIYLHRITDPRMTGSALKNLYMFQRLCGNRGLSNVVLATTMWSDLMRSDVGEETGLKRENELSMKQFWGSMLDRGSEMVRHDGTKDSALSIVSSLVQKKSKVILDIQVQLVEEKKTLDETSAGQYLQKESLEARKRYERDLREYQEEMEAAMEENNQAMLEALQKEKEAAEAKEQARLADWKKLNITVKQLAQDKEKDYKKVVDALQVEEESVSQDGNEPESETAVFESHVRGLHSALKEEERRHKEELAELKRITDLMQKREQLWLATKSNLEQKLDLEKRRRREDEHRINRLERHRHHGKYLPIYRSSMIIL